MGHCLTCEDGYEVVPIYSDCTGLCFKSGDSVEYFKNLGFGDLATSACIANLNCYEGDDLAAMEALPRDGTNDQFADDDDDDDQFVDVDGIVDLCTDETGFFDCLDAVLFSGEVTDDEVDAAFDAISGFEDEVDADTCAEFLQEPGLAAQCGSWTLGVCDDEYKAWTGCLFTTSFAQNGLDCQVDCDAVIGTPSRPSTLPPTMPTRPPTDNDSDGALGLTTTLAATAVAVAVAF